MPQDLRDNVTRRQSTHRPLERGTAKNAVERERTCAAPSCATRLSRYNPSERCSAHTGWRDERQRHHA